MTDNNEKPTPTEAMEQQLCAFILGELDQGERAHVEQRIAESETWRKEHARLSSTMELVRSAMGAPADGVQESLSQASMTTLAAAARENQGGASGGVSRGASPMRLFMPIAAGLTVALGGMWAYRSMDGSYEEELGVHYSATADQRDPNARSNAKDSDLGLLKRDRESFNFEAVSLEEKAKRTMGRSVLSSEAIETLNEPEEEVSQDLTVFDSVQPRPGKESKREGARFARTKQSDNQNLITDPNANTGTYSASHGGAYHGPSDVVPPGGGGGTSGGGLSVQVPTAGGPSTPGPAQNQFGAKRAAGFDIFTVGAAGAEGTIALPKRGQLESRIATSKVVKSSDGWIQSKGEADSKAEPGSPAVSGYPGPVLNTQPSGGIESLDEGQTGMAGGGKRGTGKFLTDSKTVAKPDAKSTDPVQKPATDPQVDFRGLGAPPAEAMEEILGELLEQDQDAEAADEKLGRLADGYKGQTENPAAANRKDRFRKDPNAPAPETRKQIELRLRVEMEARAKARSEAIMRSCLPTPNETPRDMYFRWWGDNPFVYTSTDKQATFAADVDTASYTLARRYLVENVLPTKHQVRTEEFVNYFAGDITPPTEDVFAVSSEAVLSPFGGSPNRYMLRVGVRGKVIPKAERPPMALVYVVDTSGSMKQGNRMELVKHSLRLLGTELDSRDQVGIVTFNDTAKLMLQMTSMDDRATLETAIQSCNRAAAPTSRTACAWATNCSHGFRRKAVCAGSC